MVRARRSTRSNGRSTNSATRVRSLVLPPSHRCSDSSCEAIAFLSNAEVQAQIDRVARALLDNGVLTRDYRTIFGDHQLLAQVQLLLGSFRYP
jgi:hypothetical protein